jgi:hypothetical protein
MKKRFEEFNEKMKAVDIEISSLKVKGAKLLATVSESEVEKAATSPEGTGPSKTKEVLHLVIFEEALKVRKDALKGPISSTPRPTKAAESATPSEDASEGTCREGASREGACR